MTRSNVDLVKRLIEGGYMELPKRGRPPIYASEDGRKQALMIQKRACCKTYRDRLRDANLKMIAVMSERSNDEAENPNPIINAATIGS